MYRAAKNSALAMSSRRRRFCLRTFAFLCLFLLVSGMPQHAGAQSTPGEYQVKAAFLFHFAQLVEWPAGALNGGDASIRLCIFDDEPQRQELQSTIEGKTIGTRVLHVLVINEVQEIPGCNAIFLSRDQARRQTSILRSIAGTGILTVGETSNFLSEGGMIRFHVDEGKIRFDINLDAAESSHLQISSRLLLLSTSVIRGHTTERGR